MIMDTTSTANIAQQKSPAYKLMENCSKRGAAALIAADCCNATANVATTIQQQQADGSGGDGDAAAADSALTRCKLLDDMLDVLLNPYDAISEGNNLEWLRWLMAGGKTPDEFSSAVKVYDYGTCCGLVWTANYVAYRCRTCSISPCMSLCGDCFKRGDHTGHDFNMFRSQAGGACDCGDTSVMKPDGFCRKHSSTINIDGSSTSSSSGCKQPPADLLRVAERIMPRLLLRLVQYLRENSKIADSRTSNTHVPSSLAARMTNQQQNLLLIDLDPFLGMLHDLGALGAAMRRVMTVSLTNEKIYRWACNYYSSTDNFASFGSDSSLQQQQQQQQQTMYTKYTDKVRRYYAEAIHQYTTSSPSPSSSSSRRRRHSNTTIGDVFHDTNSSSEDDDDDDEDAFGQDDWLVDGSGRKNKLNHTSFLQEIVFWTVRYEFPQKMVCFLLNMLPDAAYKEALTEAFVMHYGCVARVLATTRDSDTLSNHIVHISVQLFSNEALATRMVDKLGLLRIMVSSLRNMMTKILIPSTLHVPINNRHRVVDCSKAVMKEHCYWPLVSDLNNVLSHRPIAVKFMCDDRLLDKWFSYLSMFQGMNVNCRELGHHVEFEPNTYYAAFSAELEASAYPMWAMLSHLTSSDTLSLSTRVLRACLKRLREWLIDVGYYYNQEPGKICGGIPCSSANFNASTSTTIIRRLDDRHQFTFHLPLHRYLAVFLCQAVRAQGACIEDIIPRSSTNDSADRDALLMAIAAHPVRAQSAFYEIMQDAWVRNGLQIKGQAMTYIQSNFCISMVDADIYLLQLCLSELSDANIFMSLILEKFKVYDWMHVVKHGGLPQVMDSEEYDAAPSMDGLLVFLATLVGVRTNLCSDEDFDYCQSQLEMVTLLCVSDKTHSQLMELMPERCGGIQTSATTTTSPINISGDSASQNPSSPDQELPPTRDFETVLQAVAEYKRPQLEASGNMQQGLYVPLAHVWQKLYDPVHVLLRAVNRRDFQSSMDRYTTFMRTIGLLKQNQSTWPPYRMPQQHHPAYRNPCRALLSRLFHAVAWHCLYRSAVYRDISEQTLSLLIYLLDQAWIFYNNSSIDINTSNNLHQPMDTDQPASSSSTSSAASAEEYCYENIKTKSCPKRKIKITVADASSLDSDKANAKETSLLLLDRWYGDDDLAQNLCTTITHVELPPPYYRCLFGEEATNAAAASTMATNLFDYLTSSVAAAASVANSSSPTTVSHNFETGNSQQQPNDVPSMATIAGNDLPLAGSSIPTRPPFYSLNAAAAATSSTMADSALNHVKQRLQFLRPPPKIDLPYGPQQSSSSDVIDLTLPESSFDAMSNDNGASTLGVDRNQLVIEVDDQQNPLVCINESIISLLLKLHSHLSGEPDSYQLPVFIPQTTTSNVIDGAKSNESGSENDNTEEVPPCGDGAFYVGRLLDRIARGSTTCYDCILRTRVALWPISVVMRETASRDDKERERRERKRRARDKQQQMLEEMARAQQAFLESACRSGDLDSTDTQVQMQIQSTSATTTNMECDVPAPILEVSTSTTSSHEATTSKLTNTIVEIDDNSSSSNSTTTTTTKESAIIIRGPDHQENTLTVDCGICKKTVIVQIEQQRRDPVGLVILVQGTNVLAHRRHIVSKTIESSNLCNFSNSNSDTTEHQKQEPHTELVTGLINSNSVENSCVVNNEQNYYRFWPALPPLNSQQHHQQSTSVVNDPKSQKQHKQPIVSTLSDNYDATTYASHSDRRKRLMSQYFNNLDKADFEVGSLTTTTSATPIVGNAHVQTCGHHLHLRCWRSYLACMRDDQRSKSDMGEYRCPLCQQLANFLMPLIPEVPNDQNQRQRVCAPLNTIVTTSAMSDAVSKLTELVKQQEYQSPDPEQSNDAVCCGETSTSVFIGDTENIVNRHPLHQNVHHHHFNDDYFLTQDQVHDISPGGDGEDRLGGNGGEGDDLDSGEDPLLNAVNRCVNDMITTTQVTAATQTIHLPYKVRWHSVVSVAWTNIQVELVQRNNSLIEQLQQEQSSMHCGNNYNRHLNLFSAPAISATDINGSNNYYNMLPKRNCIAPLLKVLSVSARSLMAKYQTPDYNPISDVWYKLIGCEQPRQQLSSTYPPLLMRDPCSVLLQLVLLLPTLDRDLFDALIKLTYNMQLYIAALKVASTWNRNCKFNRQLYHRLRHHSSLNTRKMSTRTDGSSSFQMDLDDGCNNKLSSSSMDITEVIDDTLPLTPLFSQVVDLAKTIVFLSDEDKTEIVNTSVIVNNDDEFMMHHEDEVVENFVSDDKLNKLMETSEDDEENMLMLESYGRRSTLPFLKFAALLKKYINGDDDDNLDDHPDLTISSQQLNNLNVELNKHKGELLDSQERHSHQLSPPLVEVNLNIDSSSVNNPQHHQNWSKDDYEYLTLARYLKLLSNNEESHEASDHHEKSFNYNFSNIENNQKDCEQKHIMPLLPPSAMEAVIWPQWSYSTNDNNISTTISRAWLTSFRESLTTKIPKATVIGKSTTTIVSSAAAEIDPNSKATTSANIIMATRMLLFADCCDGVGFNDDSSAGMFPPINWTGPRLLKLPYMYDDVFQYYHGRACHQCQSVPRESSVCLVCGTVVCLRQSCCKTNHICEAVQHSLECGGGTGMFLVVTSSSVIVIRGKQACNWGSVYLDAYGEEDRDLKRGKPLYLSAERYRLLEHQWLAHRFDHTHTNQKWGRHNDAL